jgi:hypothetical protein
MTVDTRLGIATNHSLPQAGIASTPETGPSMGVPNESIYSFSLWSVSRQQ